MIELEDGSCIATVGDGIREGDPEQAEANAHFIVQACKAHGGLREASQRIYNAVQDYLRVPDSELPVELVEAMDALEAAWRKADGSLSPTQPNNGNE